MKAGDTVFIHHIHDVSLVCAVEEITDNEIRLYVINGAYELRITKAEPPMRDYNEAIQWFRETREASAPKPAPYYEEGDIPF